jgi:hypothetical protein
MYQKISALVQRFHRDSMVSMESCGISKSGTKILRPSCEHFDLQTGQTDINSGKSRMPGKCSMMRFEMTVLVKKNPFLPLHWPVHNRCMISSV